MTINRFSRADIEFCCTEKANSFQESALLAAQNNRELSQQNGMLWELRMARQRERRRQVQMEIDIEVK